MSGYRAYYPTSPMHIGETMNAMAVAVYMAVCHHAQSSSTCTAGIPRLARLAGASSDSVRRTLRKLSEQGHITLRSRPGRPYEICVVGWRVRKLDPSQSATPTPSREQGDPSQSATTPLAESKGTPRRVLPELRGVTTRTNNEEEQRGNKPAREQGPPPSRLRDLRARTDERKAEIASAMTELRSHCEETGARPGGFGKIRTLLEQAQDRGIALGGVIARLIHEAPAWNGCDFAGSYWAKPERLPAIIDELAHAPDPSTTAEEQQSHRDHQRITHAVTYVPAGAPPEVAYHVVHAEAREELGRHSLTTWEQVTAWLEAREVQHAA